ncbi:MAG: glycosyltransferase [Caldilineaceae bacterium]|nr:glycosyltransferase [Caldilineaceae bacterium]
MQDLVCVSHLRWDFVWQRPQHLLSRLAQTRRVFFVEEPISVGPHEPLRLDHYCWQGSRGETVEVFRLMQPTEGPRWIGHGDALTDERYRTLLADALAERGVQAPLLWLYTPMAHGFIDTLAPAAVIYDVMDQLAAFKDAPLELSQREHNTLCQANIVFTGGVSLYREKSPHNPNTYLFPSGVETGHFAQREGLALPDDLRALPRPILGYFGVIDERMDLELLAKMAQQHPEWSIVMIGPVIKISHEELPQAPNLHFIGMRAYAELPAYLAHFDVALIPFAMNDSTRYLSPTKTLEYMAAHKPIVSTPVPDVIELYGTVVRIGATHAQFIAQVGEALRANDAGQRLPLERELLAQNSWDAIAQRMADLLERQTA